jgi:hypothetical protein
MALRNIFEAQQPTLRGIELIKCLLGRCELVVSLTMMAMVETGKNNGLGKNI